MNGTVCCNLKNQAVIVSLLLYAEWLTLVVDITNRSVYRVDWNHRGLCAVLSVLISWNVTASLVDADLNLHFSRLVEMAND